MAKRALRRVIRPGKLSAEQIARDREVRKKVQEGFPPAPDELVIELSSRDIQLYEMITGQTFVPVTEPPILERLAQNLAKYLG